MSKGTKMTWKRPVDVPIGRVWRRFKGRDRNGTPARNYQIRDIEEKDKQRCIDFAQESFLRDEPLCQYFKILSDPVSVATIISNWWHQINQNVSLACYTEDEAGRPDELVAVDICEVHCLDDDDEETDQPGEAWGKLLSTLVAIDKSCNVYKHFGVDKYFSSNVLTVSSEHRGQNIGVEIFRATEELSRALEVKAMATAVTAVTSQALTIKCGYELLSELPYSDMKAHGIDISGCSTPSAKVMGTLLSS